MMTTVLLWGAIVPALVAAAVGVLTLQPWRDQPREVPRGTGALVLAAAYMASYQGLHGIPDLPPTEVAGWTFYLAPIFGLIAFVDDDRLGLWRRWSARTGLVVVACAMLVEPLRQPGWAVWRATALTAGPAAAILAWWAALDALTVRQESPFIPLALAIGLGAGAAAIAASATIVTGTLGGALAAALFIFAIVGLFRGKLAARSAVAVWAPLAGLLLFYGALYAGLPPAVWGCVAVAPAVAWVGELPAVRGLSTWLRGATRVAATAIVGVLAIGVAWVEPFAPADYGSSAADAADADGSDAADNDGSYAPY